jgi:hypothetical protein
MNFEAQLLRAVRHFNTFLPTTLNLPETEAAAFEHTRISFEGHNLAHWRLGTLRRRRYSLTGAGLLSLSSKPFGAQPYHLSGVAEVNGRG